MVAGAPLTAVFFDAYGTLLELDDPVRSLRSGLERAGYVHDVETVASAFRAEVADYRRNQDRGRDATSLDVLRRGCATTFSAALPSRPPVDIAVAILTTCLRYRLFDDVIPALDVLAVQGVRCAVVSNWDCSLPGVLAQLGILERFAAVSVSAVVGVRKPDPRIFEHTLTLLGVEQRMVVHVGDDPECDVAGARSAGVRAVLIDRSGRAADATDERITSLRSVASLLG